MYRLLLPLLATLLIGCGAKTEKKQQNLMRKLLLPHPV